jgi:hypothetical protein
LTRPLSAIGPGIAIEIIRIDQHVDSLRFSKGWPER